MAEQSLLCSSIMFRNLGRRPSAVATAWIYGPHLMRVLSLVAPNRGVSGQTWLVSACEG